MMCVLGLLEVKMQEQLFLKNGQDLLKNIRKITIKFLKT